MLKIIKLHKYWALTAIILVILSFILFEFNESKNENFTRFIRLTLCPIILLSGYAALFISILKAREE